MAERKSVGDKGKAKVEDQEFCDDAFQEDPDLSLPFKKRREEEGHSHVEDEDEIHTDTTAPSSNTKMESQPGQQVIPSNIPAQIQRNFPAPPGSRDLSSEAIVISKTLHGYDVIQENPRLYVDDIEASILADDPDIDEFPLDYNKTILAFDSEDRRYLMVLSNYKSGGKLHYSLGGEWKTYIRNHGLRAGDEVTFYKILDKNICSEYYYVLRFYRKPPDRKVYRPAAGRGNRKRPSDDSQKDSKSGGMV